MEKKKKKERQQDLYKMMKLDYGDIGIPSRFMCLRVAIIKNFFKISLGDGYEMCRVCICGVF